MSRDVYIKVSGVVLETPRCLDRFHEQLLDLCHATDGAATFHVIPGGGRQVDALRDEWNAGGQQDDEQETYHWLAIDAMDVNASRLRARVAGDRRISVPFVRDALHAKPGLPATWAVTSDSITYHLATRDVRGAPWPLIILLKNVDGVHDIGGPRRVTNLAGTLVPRLWIHGGIIEPRLASYPFDDYLATLASTAGCPFYIVNVERMERIECILAGERDVTGTMITVRAP